MHDASKMYALIEFFSSHILLKNLFERTKNNVYMNILFPEQRFYNTKLAKLERSTPNLSLNLQLCELELKVLLQYNSPISLFIFHKNTTKFRVTFNFYLKNFLIFSLKFVDLPWLILRLHSIFHLFQDATFVFFVYFYHLFYRNETIWHGSHGQCPIYNH